MIGIVAVCGLLTLFSLPSLAETVEDNEGTLTLPKNVISITKENTFPNASEEMTIVEPSTFTKKLIENTEIPIENPEVITLLNESNVKTTPLTLGYQSDIFLGRW